MKIMTKFCTECGSKLEPQAKFCSDCGNRIIQAESQVVDRPKSESNSIKSANTQEVLRAKVSSRVRVTPIYGAGFREGVHCLNCGAKRGNSKSCQMCDSE